MFDFPITNLQIHTQDWRPETVIAYVKILKELVALIADGNKAFGSVFQWGFTSQASNFL